MIDERGFLTINFRRSVTGRGERNLLRKGEVYRRGKLIGDGNGYGSIIYNNRCIFFFLCNFNYNISKIVTVFSNIVKYIFIYEPCVFIYLLQIRKINNLSENNNKVYFII